MMAFIIAYTSSIFGIKVSERQNNQSKKKLVLQKFMEVKQTASEHLTILINLYYLPPLMR